jgi:hypothetical protein
LHDDLALWSRVVRPWLASVQDLDVIGCALTRRSYSANTVAARRQPRLTSRILFGFDWLRSDETQPRVRFFHWKLPKSVQEKLWEEGDSS